MTTGVLIDPFEQTVTEIPLPPDGVSFAPLIDCEYFDCVMLRHPVKGDPGAALYLDDTGMTRPDQRFWCFANQPDRIFAGKGLITAVDETGSTTNGVSAPNVIAEHVVWRPVKFAGFEDFTEENVEIAPGVMGFKMTRQVRFEPEDETGTKDMD